MKKFLALVLSLMALCCFALAEDVQPIYTEDFEDGAHDVYLTNNCEAGCIAEVAEEDGNKYLHVVTNTGDAENGYVQVAFGPELRNFDYTVRVRPYIKNPDWNWMKVVLRGLDGTTIEMVGDGYENEAYLFNIWEWRGVFAIKSLQNRKSENTALVENQDFWFDNGTWYTIKVEARENNIKVYVDGELCVEYTDEENIRPSGIFGFCSWGANFDVDDISIVSYDAPKTEETAASPEAEAVEEVVVTGPIDMLPLISAEAGNIQQLEDGAMRNMSQEYGVVPIPKYSVDQKTYYSQMHDGFTIACFPNTVKSDRADMLSAVLEAMSSVSYRIVRPVYYETTLRTKLAQDPQSAAMMDIIVNNTVIDAGFVYSHSMGSFHQGFQQLVDKGENDAISRYKRMTTSAQRSLEGLIRQLDKMATQQ